MRIDQGFDILHNGMPRTFRDQKAMAYEAARFAKTQNPADIIEIVDRSNGTKMVLLADGRTA
jgi:hypothetical protein